MRRVLFLIALVCVAALTATAQDSTKVDPKHYKVELENAQVRVVRISYGPHEKSVMHSHTAGVITFLTDSSFKFTYPDGKSEQRTGKAGETRWADASTHLPENLSGKPAEAIYVELKAKPAAKAAAKAPAKKKAS